MIAGGPRLRFRGRAWRILPAGGVDDPTGPARAPVGRFHHSGQHALYASLTSGGAGVAIARYLSPDGPARIILPLRIDADVADLREAGASPSVVWQDAHAAGRPAPTWALSDAARAAGAQGMLYRSCSRPDLVHIVLFDLAAATPDGPAAPWWPPRT